MTEIQNSKPVYDLEERTFQFAKAVRLFVKTLPKTTANIEDGKQLIKASGSVGSNYIEANESLGKKDFLMRTRISRKEAKEIGLNIIEPKQPLESAMWNLWTDIEKDLACRQPFNPMSEVVNAGTTADLFSPVPLVQMPANLPPPVAQQAMQQILAHIAVVNIPAVEYTLRQAIIESHRDASVFTSHGKILARRDWEAKISLNNVVISSYWEKVDITQGKNSPEDQQQ